MAANKQKRIMVAISTVVEIRDRAKTNHVRAEALIKDHYTGVNPAPTEDARALFELMATSNMLVEYLEKTFDLTEVDKKVELSSAELMAITQLMKLSEEVKKVITSACFVTQ